MTNPHPIVMLPTIPNDETAGGIWFNKTRDWGHLYILSPDEEIKEEEFFYHKDMRKISHNKNTKLGGLPIGNKWHLKDIGQKIVASTDLSLGLPLIHPSFIEAYVEQYNSGKPITEVELEMERKNLNFNQDYINLNFEFKEVVKVTKDNYVVIVNNSYACICTNCGAIMNQGESETFTCCDKCWDNNCGKVSLKIAPEAVAVEYHGGNAYHSEKRMYTREEVFNILESYRLFVHGNGLNALTLTTFCQEHL